MRSRCESMLATVESRRRTSCSLLISRLKTPTLLLVPDGGVLRDVEREARLADRRPGREDDQVALLEAGRERVEVREPGADAADLAAVRVEVVEPVVRVVEERLERREAGGDAPLADGEELRLGAIDRLLDLGRILVADAGDLAGRPDQVPQHRLALDDPRVLGGVDGGRRLVRQGAEVGPPPIGFEVAAALERLRDRHDVDRLAPLEEVQHRGVDAAVRLPVEVVRLEELGDLDHGVAVDQDRPEHGLLGFEDCGGRRSIMRSRRWHGGCDRFTVAEIPAAR